MRESRFVRRCTHRGLSLLLAAGMLVTALLTLPTAGRAEDWPQWRGPNRNGLSSEKNWFASWPKSGPKVLWKVNVGQGYSSAAVSHGRLYTMGYADDKDTVWCLNAATGATIWKYSYRCAAGSYPGPRATPTVDGSVVYTVSRDGQVCALNTSNGKPFWSENVRAEIGAKAPEWGLAGSALVHGDMLILNIGATGTAVNRHNGKIVWKSGPSAAGYASPVIYSAGGKKALAIFAAKGLAGVDLSNGRQLWWVPWVTRYDVNAVDPIPYGGSLFISSDYGVGGALINVSGSKPKVVWRNPEMRNHFSNCVLVNGYLYGNDDGTLRCLDIKTGHSKWSHVGGIGKGGLIYADGKLIVCGERGDLYIVQATPSRYVELAQGKVLSGTCWTPPTLANGRIYCRNQAGELVCVAAKGR